METERNQKRKGNRCKHPQARHGAIELRAFMRGPTLVHYIYDCVRVQMYAYIHCIVEKIYILYVRLHMYALQKAFLQIDAF